VTPSVDQPDEPRIADGAAPWRSAAAQVLVGDLETPTLDDDAAHHLSRVLRLRPGAEVCATDGAGRWRRCRLASGASLAVDGEVHQVAAPRYPVTVGFALVKGAKPELVVQKLTELGIDRIVPFAAQRSVVRWDPDRATKQLARMRRVSREACAQSRRLWLPEVTELSSLSTLLESGAVVADAGGRPLVGSDRVVAVGPEGGWAESELEHPVRGDGAGRLVDRVGLGEHVLRAETAAITAGVLLSAIRSRLAAEPGA